jgi:ribokinase
VNIRAAAPAPEVVVVGSVHMDLLATAHRVPLPGESILGAGFAMYPGGKAGNQAIAVAQQGARAAIVARVGDDPFGHELQSALRRKGVDTTWLQFDAREATGASPVLMGADGAYASIIVPGASRALSPAALATVAPALRSCTVLMLQLEIALETTLAAARIAATGAARIVLNSSPPLAIESLPGQLWACVDIVVVNRTEAAALLPASWNDADAPARLARGLRGRLGVPVVVVTLGASGVVLADDAGVCELPAHDVAVIDTIGAGDAFAGATVAALARGHDPRVAVAFGNAAGALAVGKHGAHDAAPTLGETVAFLASRPAERS